MYIGKKVIEATHTLFFFIFCVCRMCVCVCGDIARNKIHVFFSSSHMYDHDLACFSIVYECILYFLKVIIIEVDGWHRGFLKRIQKKTLGDA